MKSESSITTDSTLEKQHSFENGGVNEKSRNGIDVDIGIDIDTDIDIDIANRHARLVSELAAAEGNLTVIQSLRIYLKAVLWSFFIAMSIVMSGYSSQVILSLYALPAFVEKYGTEGPDGTKILTASWQTAMSMSLAGQAVGSFAVGFVCDRIGRKWTAFCATIGAGAISFVIFFAPNAAVLTAGEVVIGIFSGSFVQLAPLYAAEVSPVALRGMLFCFSNMGLVLGQLIAQGVTTACAARNDEWAYRLPFAVPWIFCAILLIGILFMPETPWYLVHKGNKVGAKKSLDRLLCSPSPSPSSVLSIPNHHTINPDHLLSIIEQTDRIERQLHTSTNWLDLFRGPERRRTEIAVLIVTTSAFYGVPFAWYCNYFFTLAGLSTHQAFQLGVGNMAIAVFGTFLAFFILSYIGRRTVYLFGLSLLTIIMFLIAILDCLSLPSSSSPSPSPSPSPSSTSSLSWTQSILLILWNFIQQTTSGPLGFVYFSEIPSAKSKSRSMALATGSFFVGMVVTSVALPYMFNPESGDLRGKVGFVFGGVTLATLGWAYWRVPEVKGRTYAEIDYLFGKGVDARRFQGYEIFSVREG